MKDDPKILVQYDKQKDKLKKSLRKRSDAPHKRQTPKEVDILHKAYMRLGSHIGCLVNFFFLFK